LYVADGKPQNPMIATRANIPIAEIRAQPPQLLLFGIEKILLKKVPDLRFDGEDSKKVGN